MIPRPAASFPTGRHRARRSTVGYRLTRMTGEQTEGQSTSTFFLLSLSSFSVARMGGFNLLYRIESIREIMGVDDIKICLP